jgi:type II secretory pathway component PulM
LLAVGILVLALTMAWLIVIAPIVEAFGDLNDTIARSRRLVSEFEARGVAVPELRAQLDQIQKVQAGETGYVEGANPAAASSVL